MEESNIVPFPQPARPGAARAPPGATSGKPQAPQRFLDMVGREGGQDDRPFLLFDLNGTLTSHTHKRQSSGINLMRPGIHHLMQLQASVEHLGCLWHCCSESWPAPLFLAHHSAHCGTATCVQACPTSSSRMRCLMWPWLSALLLLPIGPQPQLLCLLGTEHALLLL